ncbi:MAG TPA: DUF2334 domain-containing protein [Terracidiphilus sp.]|jgi:predicted deacetylase|nr:DUF2334 domain-containing protein [Terracidiphilus sp.]
MKSGGLNPQPARYLLRFDDLCPTVSRERWKSCCELVDEFKIQPILAVVPDNQDRELQVSPPDPEFWNQTRAMEEAGATVGLHGYQHRCTAHGRSLVPLSRISEFAGVAAKAQHDWIREGLRILRGHGLDPKIWVAPRHGFDRDTLRALRTEGMQIVSDGFAHRPFLCDGLIWIPQQLWAPVEKTSGLWTICIHPNTVSDAQISAMRSFLHKYARQFISVDHALEELPPRALNAAERMSAAWSLWRVRMARAKNGLRRR